MEIAVNAAATFAALPENPAILLRGSRAVQVNTGEPLPEGTDAVVMIEKAKVCGRSFRNMGSRLPVAECPQSGARISVKGEILLPARHRIRSYDQGALLAGGILSWMSSGNPAR